MDSNWTAEPQPTGEGWNPCGMGSKPCKRMPQAELFVPNCNHTALRLSGRPPELVSVNGMILQDTA